MKCGVQLRDVAGQGGVRVLGDSPPLRHTLSAPNLNSHVETAEEPRSPRSKHPPNQQRPKQAEPSGTVCAFCTATGGTPARLPVHAHLHFSSSQTLESPPQLDCCPRNVSFSRPTPSCSVSGDWLFLQTTEPRAPVHMPPGLKPGVGGSLSSSRVSAATASEAGDRDVWSVHWPFTTCPVEKAGTHRKMGPSGSPPCSPVTLPIPYAPCFPLMGGVTTFEGRCSEEPRAEVFLREPEGQATRVSKHRRRVGQVSCRGSKGAA